MFFVSNAALQDGFSISSSEGAPTFTDIDLGDLEWVDYDEKHNCSVGIYSLRWQIRKA